MIEGGNDLDDAPSRPTTLSHISSTRGAEVSQVQIRARALRGSYFMPSIVFSSGNVGQGRSWPFYDCTFGQTEGSLTCPPNICPCRAERVELERNGK